MRDCLSVEGWWKLLGMQFSMRLTHSAAPSPAQGPPLPAGPSPALLINRGRGGRAEQVQAFRLGSRRVDSKVQI
jgi:hypothetical protein